MSDGWLGQYSQAQAEIQGLQARVAEQDREIERLNGALAGSRARIASDIPALQARVAELERERDELHAFVDRANGGAMADRARAERAEAERDEARKELAEYMANILDQRDVVLTQRTAIEAERAAAFRQLDQAEAAAAAMREALTQVHPAFGGLGRIETDAAWVNEQINAGARAKRQEVLDAVSAALSPDAGRALLEERDGLREALASLKPVFHELSSAIGLLWARTPPEAKQQLTRAQAAMERFDAALARSKGTT